MPGASPTGSGDHNRREPPRPRPPHRKASTDSAAKSLRASETSAQTFRCAWSVKKNPWLIYLKIAVS
ncbi:hypothetical protein [Nostoc sp. PA-18-2419]|uniref:hypothetical protein n=1 Tax=Nostoc sp. PA-18-2419 TaxID=2575443 RepID=UPI001109D249|nr:hypothetical protein [Nostoc sp. PA-18-2419]